MTEKRFIVKNMMFDGDSIVDTTDGGYYTTDKQDLENLCKLLNELHEEKEDRATKKEDAEYELLHLKEKYEELLEENEKLKSQLYCDDEEGVCNVCKHHYLVKDDEAELGYYNSRCKKGHYECARVSLKHCEDFEKELEE